MSVIPLFTDEPREPRPGRGTRRADGLASHSAGAAAAGRAASGGRAGPARLAASAVPAVRPDTAGVSTASHLPAEQSDLTGWPAAAGLPGVGRPRTGRQGAAGRSGATRSDAWAGAMGRAAPPPPKSALALVEQARAGLAAAAAAAEAAERYAAAHLAALRGAAAVVAVRARPDRRRTRPLSVWALLASVAPELREWAAFFAAGSRTRAAVEAGVTRLVSTRDADDLVRQAEEFVDLAERLVRGDGR